MSFLYLLEKIRFPALDSLMLLITNLGEETAFLVIALIVFWCVDKRKGYYLMAVGFLGTMLNQMMKLACRVPRPWVMDESFTIVEEAREAADGYSFPSGHTQMAVGTFGALCASSRRRWVKTVCVILMILVPFSRMYLGVHMPSDVLVGAGMALALVWLLKGMTLRGDDKAMKLLIAGMLGVGLVFLLYVELWNFPADMDAANLESGYKNAYTMLGCLIGVGIVYAADKKLDFSVEAVWWVQIIKAVLGLALVLAVKSGLKAPLEALFGGHMAARGLRYCLLVIVAGIVWPMSFRYLSRLGNKKENP